MSQHVALSVIAMDATDDFIEAFDAAAADGEICQAEIVYLTPLVRLVRVEIERVDIAQAAGLALIRGGTESYRALSLLRQCAGLDPREAA
jgi:hypothetical protein